MRWLIADTPVGAVYPCRCSERRYGKCHPKFCPCAGRTDDLYAMPAACCARTRK
jgi:hypothetical protein